MTDLTFTNIIKLFVLSFKNDNDKSTRDSFEKYYIALVKIKDFNAFFKSTHKNQI